MHKTSQPHFRFGRLFATWHKRNPLVRGHMSRGVTRALQKIGFMACCLLIRVAVGSCDEGDRGANPDGRAFLPSQ